MLIIMVILEIVVLRVVGYQMAELQAPKSETS